LDGEWFRSAPELEVFVATFVVADVATTGPLRNVVVTQAEAEAVAVAEAEADTKTDIKTLAPTSVEVAAVGVFELPLPGEQGEWQVPQKLYDEMLKAFPDVNVMGEFAKMRAWLVTRPANHKTPKGLPKFISNWLAKAEDKPRNRNAAQPNTQERLMANDAARKATRRLSRFLADSGQAEDVNAGDSSLTGAVGAGVRQADDAGSVPALHVGNGGDDA
jgi:hypothetical protein